MFFIRYRSLRYIWSFYFWIIIDWFRFCLCILITFDLHFILINNIIFTIIFAWILNLTRITFFIFINIIVSIIQFCINLFMNMIGFTNVFIVINWFWIRMICSVVIFLFNIDIALLTGVINWYESLWYIRIIVIWIVI